LDDTVKSSSRGIHASLLNSGTFIILVGIHLSQLIFPDGDMG